MIRKSLTGLVLALGLVGCGSSAPVKDDVFSTPIERASEGTLEELVELRLQVMDRWVTWFVDEDYVDEDEAFVGLRQANREQMQKYMTLGSVIRAIYDPFEDVIVMPSFKGGVEAGIDAIYHEVAHGITEKVKAKGLIYWEGYKGPDEKKIQDHWVWRIEQDDFAQLRHEVDQKIMLIELVQTLERIREDSSQYGQLLEQHREFFSKVRKSEDVNKYIHQDLREKMRSEMESYKVALTHVHTGLRLYAQWYKGLPKKDAEIFEAGVERYVGEAKALLEKTEQVEQAGSLLQTMHSTWTCAQEFGKMHKKGIEAYKAARGARKEEIKSKELTKLEALKAKCERPATQRDVMQDDFEGTEMAMQSAAQRRVSQIVYSPIEFFPRMVDSLYSLHYGKVTELRFALTARDLAFLDQFSYKGEKLFVKGLEKYRLGLEMIADGAQVEDVRAQLFMAESFSYKGKEYSWPHSGFRIKGKIPGVE